MSSSVSTVEECKFYDIFLTFSPFFFFLHLFMIEHYIIIRTRALYYYKDSSLVPSIHPSLPLSFGIILL